MNQNFSHAHLISLLLEVIFQSLVQYGACAEWSGDGLNGNKCGKMQKILGIPLHKL